MFRDTELIVAGDYSVGTSVDEWQQLANTVEPGFLWTIIPLRRRRRVQIAPLRVNPRNVTNGEFNDFIEEDGYNRRDLWSRDGWQWRTDLRRDEPLFWSSETFRSWSRPCGPVVGVTYWEAEAYAKFVGGRLPSEDEWEASARNFEDLAPDPLNCAEYWMQKTVVTRSEFDLFRASRPWRDVYMLDVPGSGSSGTRDLELQGGVWEWTRSRALSGQMIIKGGSFAYPKLLSRVDNRGMHLPYWASLGIGIRIVHHLPSGEAK